MAGSLCVAQCGVGVLIWSCYCVLLPRAFGRSYAGIQPIAECQQTPVLVGKSLAPTPLAGLNGGPSPCCPERGWWAGRRFATPVLPPPVVFVGPVNSGRSAC